jgi:two-component system sensor histidine kinase DesK
MQPMHDHERHPLRARIGATIGLLFLAPAVSDLVRVPLAPWRLAVSAAALAAFVALYLTLLPPARWIQCRWRYAMPAGIAGLGALAVGSLAAGAPQSFVPLFVYVAAAAGMLLPPRVAVAAIGVTAGATAVAAPLVGMGQSGSGSIVLTVIAIGAMTGAFGRQIRTNIELRAAREEVTRLAVSEERLRFSRDLHDLVGHSLSVIALKSELAAKLIDRDGSRAAAELADVQAVTRQALVEVREAVQGYRSLALADAVDNARTALAAAGIECRIEGSDAVLPHAVETVLAYAVRLHADDTSAAVEVSDDGRAGPASSGGSGLAGLAERAERLRGTFEAGARPEGGFRLRLTVPLAT